jgi:hypothetical protein
MAPSLKVRQDGPRRGGLWSPSSAHCGTTRSAECSRASDRSTQYLGGRSYQELVEVAQIGAMRSVDLGKTKVSGGRFSEALTDGQQRAARRLRGVEGEVVHRHGVEGLALAREVLADRRSVEATARQYGAASDREVRSIAWLFRKILNVIAMAFGFATTTRRLPPAVSTKPVRPT